MRRSKDDAEQTRTAILDAAERLFCAHGIAPTTVEKVSRAAGVTRGAFYWHFQDKTDLLQALHDRCAPPQKAVIRAAAEGGHADPLGLLEQAAVEMLTLFESDEQHQRLFRMMSESPSGEEDCAWLKGANADMFDVLSRLMAQARGQGLLSTDFAPKEAAVLMMATMNGLLGEWLRSGKAFPLADLGTRIVQMHMRVLRKGPS